MLIVSELRMLPGAKEPPSETEANAAWTVALAEAQLIGARQVVEVAQTLEANRKNRVISEAFVRSLNDITSFSSEFSSALYGAETVNRLLHEQVVKTSKDLEPLVAACKADIEALGE